MQIFLFGGKTLRTSSGSYCDFSHLFLLLQMICLGAHNAYNDVKYKAVNQLKTQFIDF